MVWPTADIPTYGRGVWLECNGQSFSRTQFPQLYEALGKTTVPNYQGMFLRGYGSQSYSQNNGEFTSRNTNYSSGSVGQIQGDAMRRLWGEISAVQFRGTDAGNGMEGSFFYEYVGNTDYKELESPTSKYYFDNSKTGYELNKMDIPYYEYRLNGNSEDGYSLSKELKYFRDYGPTIQYIFGEAGNQGKGAGYRWVGADSNLVAPSANEIRPVNMAVKFMIKAK